MKQPWEHKRLTSEEQPAAALGCSREHGVCFCHARRYDGPAEAPGQAQPARYGHAAQLSARKRRRRQAGRAAHRRAHLQPRFILYSSDCLFVRFEASVRPHQIPLVTVPCMRLPAFPPTPTSPPKTLSAQTVLRKAQFPPTAK